jgi:hypothetical protein
MTVSNQISSDLSIEAERLLDEMEARKLDVRLLGGIAIRIALGDRYHEALLRPHDDIDLITTKSDGSKVESALADLGWEPNREFNAINGARRLLFYDPATGHKVDGFVDRFEMCHKLPLTDRFDHCSGTLSPADLLLTKLQVIELNSKDRGDCYALMLGFPVAEGTDDQAIDAAWIAELASSDWGLHHTLGLNYQRLREGVGEPALDAEEQERILDSISQIEAVTDAAPKSRSWKMRDRIGERKRWYEEPEEIE